MKTRFMVGETRLSGSQAMSAHSTLTYQYFFFFIQGLCPMSNFVAIENLSGNQRYTFIQEGPHCRKAIELLPYHLEAFWWPSYAQSHSQLWLGLQWEGLDLQVDQPSLQCHQHNLLPFGTHCLGWWSRSYCCWYVYTTLFIILCKQLLFIFFFSI